MNFWKHKEESPPAPKERPQPAFKPEKEVLPVSTIPQERKPESLPQETRRSTTAHLGKTLMVKGELSGGEDLYVEGQVEGTIELREYSLTIGPNGRVHANVTAKNVILFGSLQGNLLAVDRVEIRKSGSMVGDVVAARVMIEDGASIKGSVDIQKPTEAPRTPEIKKADKPAPAAAKSHSKPAASPIGVRGPR